MTNSYERILQAAQGQGLTVRETTAGKQASMQTPGHSGRDQGTSVTYNGDRVLVYCHNGEVEDVLDALGMTHRDLFDDPKGSTYNYPDDRLVFRSVAKKFRQDGNKNGTALFGSDQLDNHSGPVYVVEGENDVLTAQNVAGVAAVTQAGGSQNNPAKANWEPLAGRDVVIVRDNDQPGHKRAGKVQAYLESLTNGPSSVQVVDVAAGKDLSDHIAAGRDLAELIPLPVEDQPRRRISLIKASSVRTERLDWLIESWVPRRSLTLLAGREGLGKSTIACGFAAQATRGELDGKPMNVAYLNTEDSRSITVKPRLQAAGADMDRVFFIDVSTETGNTGALQLPGDTSILAQELAAENVGLVILDAAKSAMHSKLDGYRDDDVRQFLEPLSAMCDQHDMAVIGLVHFGKRESADPGKLILGSVAWSQIARSVLSVAVDDEGTLVVTNTKANLAPAEISREATMESVTVDTDDGKTTSVGRIVWGENTDVSAAQLLVSHDEDQADERSEIEAVVIDYLESHGGSAPAGDVLKAARAAGLSDNAVKKARKKIGVTTEKAGMGAGWVWSIERKDGLGFTPKVLEGAEGARARAWESSAPSRESSGMTPADTGDTKDTPTLAHVPTVPTVPTGRDLHKHNVPTGDNFQQGHRDKRDDPTVPTEKPTPASITFAQPKLAGDNDLEDTVIGSLHAEYPMSIKTVEQSVPPMYRDQVPTVLDKLTADGLVILDSKDRYLLNSTRKATA